MRPVDDAVRLPQISTASVARSHTAVSTRSRCRRCTARDAVGRPGSAAVRRRSSTLTVRGTSPSLPRARRCSVAAELTPSSLSPAPRVPRSPDLDRVSRQLARATMRCIRPCWPSHPVLPSSTPSRSGCPPAGAELRRPDLVHRPARLARALLSDPIFAVLDPSDAKSDTVTEWWTDP